MSEPFHTMSSFAFCKVNFLKKKKYIYGDMLRETHGDFYSAKMKFFIFKIRSNFGIKKDFFSVHSLFCSKFYRKY